MEHSPVLPCRYSSFIPFKPHAFSLAGTSLPKCSAWPPQLAGRPGKFWLCHLFESTWHWERWPAPRYLSFSSCKHAFSLGHFWLSAHAWSAHPSFWWKSPLTKLHLRSFWRKRSQHELMKRRHVAPTRPLWGAARWRKVLQLRTSASSGWSGWRKGRRRKNNFSRGEKFFFGLDQMASGKKLVRLRKVYFLSPASNVPD